MRRTKSRIIRDTARTIVVRAIVKHGADLNKISPKGIEAAAKELLWNAPMTVLNRCYYVRSRP